MSMGKVIAAVVAAMIVVPVGCSIINTTASVTTAPGRVVSKTLETNNIIQNYERFFNTKANYDARVAQIQEQKGYLDAETDADEKYQLRVELSAMRMSCRELANDYNADSEKMNRSLFKSKGLPETLNEGTCDA